ncbi:MAG: hypothetical protein HZB39_15600 [Planctomycetes bacterium]|nr:hypothetical protein [Planctomycetota bacterium]
MSRARILRIAAAFVVAVVVLAGVLFDLAVLEHDVWFERSLRNRWAFRDVPTRRGAIVDAAGAPLAWDVPGFDLELRYATFRREHPVALCVHGANLLHEARGDAAPFDLLEPERATSALLELLAIQVETLRNAVAWPAAAALDPPPDDVARELRFHIGAAIAALAGVSRAKLAVALWAEVAGDAGGTVADALFRIAQRGDVPNFGIAAPGESAPDLATSFGRILDQRVVELRALDARLARARTDRTDFGLFAFLDERRLACADAKRLASLPAAEAGTLADLDFWSFLREQGIDWRAWPDWRGWLALDASRRRELVAGFAAEADRRRVAIADEWLDAGQERPALFARLPDDWRAPRFWDEERPRRVLARLPHELASWLALLAERHPGFLLRASVRRAHGRVPGHDDLASLATIVGSVGSYAPTGRTPELDAARVLADEADFARRADDAAFGGEVSPSVADALRARAEAALRAHYGQLGRVGRSGVEAAYDDALAGRPGLRFVERDKRAREIALFENLDVAPGADVTLTIDARLQALAEQALGDLVPGREKAIVVIDAQDGDVLAIASRLWRDGDAEPGWSTGAWSPAFNPYVGSVAKPLIALEYLAALRADPSLAGPGTFPDCGGKGSPYDRARRLRCGEVHGAGSRDTVHALAESCNVWFFSAADQLGAERARGCFAGFGWDRPRDAGAPLAHDAPALTGLPRSAWQSPRVRPAGFVSPMQAIGYGVEVWPLFVARAYAGVATGKLPGLRFVRDDGAAPAMPLPFHEQDLALVHEGLAQCVTQGTARAIRATAERLRSSSGLVLHGKTGTAEVTADGRLNNAWFAGFVGAGGDTRFAFAAVEYRTDDHGGTIAAPIAARFLEAVLDDDALRAQWLDPTPRGRR